MPLLDIATAQASLQNHLSPLRAYSHIHCKVPSSLFTYGDEKRREFSWKSFQFPRKVHSHEKSKLRVKAVATLEPKCLALKKEGQKGCHNVQHDVDTETARVQVQSSGGDSMELDEREKLRRMRISKANKGKTPWNKGRKHSPETLQRIRERTRLAMQDPKVRMKLAKLGHAQSKETRLKIGDAVRMGWRKRHEKQMVQETCFFEWQNLIAEASRKGYAGEEELQWDSYKVLSEKLELQWIESIEQRKMTKPKGSKRAPKSLEQRRKIAEAIAAKWADPDYRDRVCSALAKYHGTPVGAPRKPRRKRSDSTQSTKQDSQKKKNCYTTKSSSDTSSAIERMRLRRSKVPLYKDPMASSKLEMLKNVRAQRAAEETKKTEAIERARLLIAEAEKAANALEVAASRSPIAQASLLETRKLIAEAVQSIESVRGGLIVSNENEINPAPNGLDSHVQRDLETAYGDLNRTELISMNGTQTMGSNSQKDEDLNFTKLTFHNMLNGSKQLEHPAPSTNGLVLSPFSLETLVGRQSSSKHFDGLELNGSKSENNPLVNGSSHVEHTKEDTHSIAKKWVRGRLVEVTGGDYI